MLRTDEVQVCLHHVERRFEDILISLVFVFSRKHQRPIFLKFVGQWELKIRIWKHVFFPALHWQTSKISLKQLRKLRLWVNIHKYDPID